MKTINYSWIPLFFCMLLLSACEDVEIDIEYNIETTEEYEISEIPIVGVPVAFDTPEFETNSASAFEENNTPVDKIESITLTSLSLLIKSPDGANFNFLEDISFKIGAQGLELELLAFINDVPENNLTTLNLTTTEVDIQEYVKKEKIYLNIELLTDQPTDSKINLEVKMKFKVKAKVVVEN